MGFELPDEVERHGDVEPGIFRVDVEELFGHIDDPVERERRAKAYAEKLSDILPDGSIILPMDVEKVGDVDDAVELIDEATQ